MKKRMKKDKNWIQKIPLKKAALHRQLAVTGDIPVTLLRKIKRSKTGTTIANPTKTGKRRIPVTPLLKRRVNFALNVRR